MPTYTLHLITWALHPRINSTYARSLHSTTPGQKGLAGSAPGKGQLHHGVLERKSLKQNVLSKYGNEVVVFFLDGFHEARLFSFFWNYY